MRRRSFLTGSVISAAAHGFWGVRSGVAQGQQAADPGIGVIFIGASWCPACKKAAPVLSVMAAQSGIPVLVASHDARPIPPFAGVVDARHHPVARHYTSFPHTLIYSARTDQIEADVLGYRNASDYGRRLQRAILRAAGGVG